MTNASYQSLAAKFIREAELDIQNGLENHLDPQSAYEVLVQELNGESAVQESEVSLPQDSRKAIFPILVLEDYRASFSLCLPSNR
jgi:hypothetical protein